MGTPNDFVAVGQHKIIEDVCFANAQAFGSISPVTLASASASGLNELVRRSFTPTAPDPGEGFLVLIPPPSGRPN